MLQETNLPDRIHIKDVSPRDGLQAEPKSLSVDERVRLVDQLAEAGVPHIEVASFVRSDWLPQMDQAEAVFERIHRKPGVTYGALVPNPQGAERAVSVGPDELIVFVSASETHNWKNVHRSIQDSLEGFRQIVGIAQNRGIPVAAVIVTSFGCPYEGTVPQSQVLGLAEQLHSQGIRDITLGDTVGVAHPLQVAQMVRAFHEKFPKVRLALHFHDNRGTALTNLFGGLLAGCERFETALGGIGGSPFSPGAGGNLATEDAVYLCHEMGIESGINLNQLLLVGQYLEDAIGHALPSRVYRAGGRMVPKQSEGQ